MTTETPTEQRLRALTNKVAAVEKTAADLGGMARQAWVLGLKHGQQEAEIVSRTHPDDPYSRIDQDIEDAQEAEVKAWKRVEDSAQTRRVVAEHGDHRRSDDNAERLGSELYQACLAMGRSVGLRQGRNRLQNPLEVSPSVRRQLMGH